MLINLNKQIYFYDFLYAFQRRHWTASSSPTWDGSAHLVPQVETTINSMLCHTPPSPEHLLVLEFEHPSSCPSLPCPCARCRSSAGHNHPPTDTTCHNGEKAAIAQMALCLRFLSVRKTKYRFASYALIFCPLG